MGKYHKKTPTEANPSQSIVNSRREKRPFTGQNNLRLSRKITALAITAARIPSGTMGKFEDDLPVAAAVAFGCGADVTINGMDCDTVAV